MNSRITLCLSLLCLLASTVNAETEVSNTADDVAAYRAGIVAALRARLAAAGTPAQTTLVASPGGDDRVVTGADKQRVVIATIDANGVTMACHEGVEDAARALADARGDSHD